MKANIHPVYYDDAKVTCACGNSFTNGSTRQEVRIEVCSNCHPFFTGEAKFVDTLGKVERFQQRQKAAASKVLKKQQKLESTEEERPLTLYEMAKKIKQEFKTQENQSQKS